MTDQNNPGQADGFKNTSSLDEHDPLEELARIVSGDDGKVSAQPDQPALTPEPEPAFAAEEPAYPSATEPDDGFDLEAELMQELGGFDDAADGSDVHETAGEEPVASDALEGRYDPAEDAGAVAAQRQNFAVQEPAQADDDFDLSEALANELDGNFGVEPEAAPEPAFAAMTETAAPGQAEGFVDRDDFTAPTNVEGEPDWALQTSLEQELPGVDAEPGFEALHENAEIHGIPDQEAPQDLSPAPLQAETEAPGTLHAEPDQPDPMEEFERALSEIPLDEPAIEPVVAEPTAEVAGAGMDELSFEEPLQAAATVQQDGFSSPAEHEIDDLDLDFGAAFEAEVDQLHVASQDGGHGQEGVSFAAEQDILPDVAPDTVPTPQEAAPEEIGELALEDEFAAAFEDELNFGDELASDLSEVQSEPSAYAEQAVDQADLGASQDDALWSASEDEGANNEFAAAATTGLAAAGAAALYSRNDAYPADGLNEPASADIPAPTQDPYFDDPAFDEVHQGDTFAADPDASADPMLDMDQDVDIPPPPDTGSSDGRGFKIAAIALGVALFAGFGAVAYSFLGDGQSADPVVITADSDPIKVKPEDPGGKVVANQDKAAYESVEGGDTADTNQDRLVSTTEEPVDVASNTANDAAAGADKSDERLSPGTENESESGGALIAPRKVRTLTVKPDGTIVASPAPAPELATPPATTQPTVDTAQNLEQPTETAALDTGAENAATETASAGPAPIGEARTTGELAIPEPSPLPKPRSAEVTFTPPTATPAPVARAPATPSVTPAPAPATAPAPTGDDAPIQIASTPSASSSPAATSAPSSAPWAVQISSQRSEAAAQASYQNLRSRFSSVLASQPVEVRQANIEGRGTFYRVRIPANSRDAANNICNRLQAAGGSCFVTR